jgi:hypothetical protein
MKRHARTLLLIAAAIIGTAFTFQTQTAPRVEWEYRVYSTAQDEKLLNLMGAQGWELFMVREQGRGDALFYFKRQK